MYSSNDSKSNRYCSNVHSINEFLLIACCYQHDSVEISLFVLENVLSYRNFLFPFNILLFLPRRFRLISLKLVEWLVMWCSKSQHNAHCFSLQLTCVNDDRMCQQPYVRARDFVEYHIHSVVFSIFLVLYKTIERNRKKQKLISSRNLALAPRFVNCDQ